MLKAGPLHLDSTSKQGLARSEEHLQFAILVFACHTSQRSYDRGKGNLVQVLASLSSPRKLSEQDLFSSPLGLVEKTQVLRKDLTLLRRGALVASLACQSVCLPQVASNSQE